jgi:hypothetical protein
MATESGKSGEQLTVFECGPKRTCDHDMSLWEDLYDEDGRVCGGTQKCSKCGETAFNISMWEGP